MERDQNYHPVSENPIDPTNPRPVPLNAFPLPNLVEVKVESKRHSKKMKKKMEVLMKLESKNIIEKDISADKFLKSNKANDLDLNGEVKSKENASNETNNKDINAGSPSLPPSSPDNGFGNETLQIVNEFIKEEERLKENKRQGILRRVLKFLKCIK